MINSNTSESSTDSFNSDIFGTSDVSDNSEVSVTSEVSTPSTDSEVSVTLHPLHDIKERIEASEKARNEMPKELAKLYSQFIDKRFYPIQDTRKSDLAAMVTFLHRAVGRERLLLLVGAFYDLNQEFFEDPREQHMEEAESHIRDCDETWLNELSDEEKSIVEMLPERNIEAFRVCRDLAMHENDTCERHEFFLSCCDLGNRISIDDQQAGRILRFFRSVHFLEIVEKGTRREQGVRARATSFRWLLGGGAIASIVLFWFLPLTNSTMPPTNHVGFGLTQSL